MTNDFNVSDIIIGIATVVSICSAIVIPIVLGTLWLIGRIWKEDNKPKPYGLSISIYDEDEEDEEDF